MDAIALANNSRPSAARAVGAGVVAQTASAAAHATNRRRPAVAVGTVAPLLKQLEQDNNNHTGHTVNFGNSSASVERRVHRGLS